jgi:hypothetical protein
MPFVYDYVMTKDRLPRFGSSLILPDQTLVTHLTDPQAYHYFVITL